MKYSQTKDVGIIFAGGGSSQRFGKTNKLLECVNDIPLFIHSIITFATICNENNMVVVVRQDDLEQFQSSLKRYSSLKNITFVNGGETRLHSVKNGLKALPQSVQYVAIHDLARPLATTRMLDSAISCVKNNQTGAIIAQRIVNTIKRSDDYNIIEKTVSRDNLWSIETPQIFHKNKLLNAYEALTPESAQQITDDAGIMELAGNKIELVESTEFNIKITYPNDIRIANAMLLQSK